jgi:hypothetical protein
MESNKVTGAVYLPAVKRFNHSLKILARDLSKRCPNDPMVFRIHKRTMSLVDVLPIFVIDTVGPYLYSYREQIYSGSEKDEEFFLEHTFETEVKGLDNPESADTDSTSTRGMPPVRAATAKPVPPSNPRRTEVWITSALMAASLPVARQAATRRPPQTAPRPSAAESARAAHHRLRPPRQAMNTAP